MDNPEIHVHVHFHGGAGPEAVASRLAVGDILTEHTYEKPTPPPPPGQEDLFSAPAPAPAATPQATNKPEKPVAITPQTAHDQRREIADYSERNKHLVRVDKLVSKANSDEAAADRIKMGRLHNYSEAGLRKNAEEAKAQAARELVAGCGHCALDCAIRGNFPKWDRIHEAAEVAKTADQEPRKAWRRRLVKDADAHCLPGKTKKPSAAKRAA